jgi:aryl-alcohol dehydrogenase-like predicted oxidoreductase
MVRRRSLGKTGLMVSELSLGTVELGLEYGIAAPGQQLKPDERQAAEVLNAALDLGINLLDTARAYGDAEAIIGRTLKGRRNEFILVSKVVASPQQPQRVRELVEESLQTLQVEHVDVMLIHCGADALPDEDTAGELLKLRDSGAIGFIGASVYGEEAALTAIGSNWCDCIEIAHSMMDRRPEARVIAQAKARQTGVLARSVLLKGALTKRIDGLPVAFLPLKTAVRQLLEATQATIEELPEIAYRYILMQQLPHSALVGSARISELQACASYAAKGPLPPEMVSRIQSVVMPDARWLNPGLWPPV